MFAAQGQAGVAAEFVFVADLRSPLVVFAAAGDGVEPQAAVPRFLSAEQSEEVVVDLADQFFG